MGKVPDRIDLQIIETLRQDGRTPNKSIAKRLNVSETTIASRIRAMTERNVMRVTLQRDIYSLGYQFQGFLDLYVAAGKVSDVARDVSAINGVLAVAVYLGSPDILVSFGAAIARSFAYRQSGRCEGSWNRTPRLVRRARHPQIRIELCRAWKDRHAN